MMIANEDRKDIEKIINSSGFPFQLAVKSLIENAYKKGEFRWDVLTDEYPWVNRNDKTKNGFIDIILEKERCRAVIECKRVRNSKWIFVTDSDGFHDKISCYYTKCVFTGDIDKDKIDSDYFTFSINPKIPKAEFCILRGSSDTDKPLLERLAYNVLMSIESIANDEISIARSRHLNSLKNVYIPIIVTNAKLIVCRTDYKDIALDTGDINKADLEVVDYVHFKKTLTFEQSTFDVKTIKDLNENAKRSIFVTNPNGLINLLATITLDRTSNGSIVYPFD